jgi:hypothetical protein
MQRPWVLMLSQPPNRPSVGARARTHTHTHTHTLMQEGPDAQAYEFWRHEFVRSNAQIQNLLENIARFCAPQPGGSGKPGEAGMEGRMEAQQSALR